MPTPIAWTPVPEREIEVAFSRSSGPGGQNVNRRSTRVQARWNVGASSAFTDEQKGTIRAVAAGHLNAADEIVVAAEDERSQLQNRHAAVARLQAIVARALAPRTPRVPTKPTAASKRKRFDQKRLRSRAKERRRPPKGEW